MAAAAERMRGGEAGAEEELEAEQAALSSLLGQVESKEHDGRLQALQKAQVRLTSLMLPSPPQSLSHS